MADLLENQPERLKPEDILPKEENLVEADEKAKERLPESKDEFLEKPLEQAPVTKVIEGQPTTAAALPPAAPKDEITVEVEKILEDGLGEHFSKLKPEEQKIFKQKGEQTSKELAGMVRGLQVKMKRALQLVRDWLLCIPGINKFFLEQEAKIKVDRLVDLVEARKESAQKRT
jgi:hypothetical protein